MRIDAHHHLWRYSPAQYDWIDGRMLALRRDFLVEDLSQVTPGTGVEATVVVQARQSREETEWLLEQANRYVAIRGVVGWGPDLRACVSHLAGRRLCEPAPQGPAPCCTE